MDHHLMMVHDDWSTGTCKQILKKAEIVFRKRRWTERSSQVNLDCKLIFKLKKLEKSSLPFSHANAFDDDKATKWIFRKLEFYWKTWKT